MRIGLLITSNIFSAYIFILVFRIIISWFAGIHYGKLREILTVITDPYFNLFRRVRFLRRGSVDLSPILAILVLQIVTMVLRYVATAVIISLVTILVSIALAVWHTVFWFLILVGLLVIIRIVGILILRRPNSRFSSILDSILGPPVTALTRRLPRSWGIGYPGGLVILFILLVLFTLCGVLLIEPSLLLLLGVGPG